MTWSVDGELVFDPKQLSNSLEQQGLEIPDDLMRCNQLTLKRGWLPSEAYVLMSAGGVRNTRVVGSLNEFKHQILVRGDRFSVTLGGLAIDRVDAVHPFTRIQQVTSQSPVVARLVDVRSVAHQTSIHAHYNMREPWHKFIGYIERGKNKEGRPLSMREILLGIWKLGGLESLFGAPLQVPYGVNMKVENLAFLGKSAWEALRMASELAGLTFDMSGGKPRLIEPTTVLEARESLLGGISATSIIDTSGWFDAIDIPSRIRVSVLNADYQWHRDPDALTAADYHRISPIYSKDFTPATVGSVVDLTSPAPAETERLAATVETIWGAMMLRVDDKGKKLNQKQVDAHLRDVAQAYVRNLVAAKYDHTWELIDIWAFSPGRRYGTVCFKEHDSRITTRLSGAEVSEHEPGRWALDLGPGSPPIRERQPYGREAYIKVIAKWPHQEYPNDDPVVEDPFESPGENPGDEDEDLPPIEDPVEPIPDDPDGPLAPIDGDFDDPFVDPLGGPFFTGAEPSPGLEEPDEPSFIEGDYSQDYEIGDGQLCEVWIRSGEISREGCTWTGRKKAVMVNGTGGTIASGQVGFAKWNYQLGKGGFWVIVACQANASNVWQARCVKDAASVFSSDGHTISTANKRSMLEIALRRNARGAFLRDEMFLQLTMPDAGEFNEFRVKVDASEGEDNKQGPVYPGDGLSTAIGYWYPGGVLWKPFLNEQDIDVEDTVYWSNNPSLTSIRLIGGGLHLEGIIEQHVQRSSLFPNRQEDACHILPPKARIAGAVMIADKRSSSTTQWGWQEDVLDCTIVVPGMYEGEPEKTYTFRNGLLVGGPCQRPSQAGRTLTDNPPDPGYIHYSPCGSATKRPGPKTFGQPGPGPGPSPGDVEQPIPRPPFPDPRNDPPRPTIKDGPRPPIDPRRQ